MNNVFDFLGSIPRRLGVTRERFGAFAYFWIRQVFHFAGGCVVGVIPAAIGLWSRDAWMAAVVVFSSLLMTAVFMSETTDAKGGQPLYKTVADVTAWVSGFAVVGFSTV